MDVAALEQLSEAVPAPMLVVDGASRVILANTAARAMLGPTLTGRPFVTVLRQPSINHALDEALASRPGGQPQKLAMQLSVDGQDRGCAVTITRLALSGKIAAGIVIEDSSGVETAEQMRRDFVANVSHELKTPLTALMGFIETLQGPARNDPAARERFLGIMGREAGRMDRLIGDLLSLSRVEQEERRRPSQAVELAGMIRSTCMTLAQTAAAGGVTLSTEGVDQRAEVAADPDQILQVLQNLIENGIKYGGNSVRVTLSHVPHEPVLRGPGWAVQVADNGEGIDEVHLPRLTERFYRVDAHRSREKGGTGLGLAIVKHIISRHRGRLKIESKAGQGSRFTMILPQKQG